MAKFLIFEGADGVGKTSTVDRLVKKYGEPYVKLQIAKRSYFSKIGESPAKLVLDDPNSLTLYLELLNNLDPENIWVMDRSILSNLAYTCSDRKLSEQAVEYMQQAHEVVFVVLDRDFVEEDFCDDLLNVSKEDFNNTIQFYRDWTPTFSKVYKTKLVNNGVFDNLKQDLLIEKIDDWMSELFSIT